MKLLKNVFSGARRGITFMRRSRKLFLSVDVILDHFDAVMTELEKIWHKELNKVEPKEIIDHENL